MNDFLGKFLKIRSGFFRRIRVIFFLDLIAIFSIIYASLIILNAEFFLGESSIEFPLPVKIIPPLTAFIAGMFLAIFLHRKDKKIDVTLIIEQKKPELKEKLRTAYDNRDETNIIVESLKANVSDLLASVSSSKILSSGKIFSRILITAIFITGAFFIYSDPGQYSIPPDTLKGYVGNITGDDIEPVGPPEDFDDESRGGGKIYGKPKIASIEGKNIDLTLYSGMDTGFEVREASDTRNQFIRSAEFPVDVLGSNVSDGGYSILIKKTEIEKELINKYAVERSKI